MPNASSERLAEFAIRSKNTLAGSIDGDSEAASERRQRFEGLFQSKWQRSPFNEYRKLPIRSKQLGDTSRSQYNHFRPVCRTHNDFNDRFDTANISEIDRVYINERDRYISGEDEWGDFQHQGRKIREENMIRHNKDEYDPENPYREVAVNVDTHKLNRGRSTKADHDDYEVKRVMITPNMIRETDIDETIYQPRRDAFNKRFDRSKPEFARYSNDQEHRHAFLRKSSGIKEKYLGQHEIEDPRCGRSSSAGKGKPHYVGIDVEDFYHRPINLIPQIAKTRRESETRNIDFQNEKNIHNKPNLINPPPSMRNERSKNGAAEYFESLKAVKRHKEIQSSEDYRKNTITTRRFLTERDSAPNSILDQSEYHKHDAKFAQRFPNSEMNFEDSCGFYLEGADIGASGGMVNGRSASAEIRRDWLKSSKHPAVKKVFESDDQTNKDSKRKMKRARSLQFEANPNSHEDIRSPLRADRKVSVGEENRLEERCIKKNNRKSGGGSYAPDQFEVTEFIGRMSPQKQLFLRKNCEILDSNHAQNVIDTRLWHKNYNLAAEEKWRSSLNRGDPAEKGNINSEAINSLIDCKRVDFKKIHPSEIQKNPGIWYFDEDSNYDYLREWPHNLDDDYRNWEREDRNIVPNTDMTDPQKMDLNVVGFTRESGYAPEYRTWEYELGQKKLSQRDANDGHFGFSKKDLVVPCPRTLHGDERKRYSKKEMKKLQDSFNLGWKTRVNNPAKPPDYYFFFERFNAKSAGNKMASGKLMVDDILQRRLNEIENCGPDDDVAAGKIAAGLRNQNDIEAEYMLQPPSVKKQLKTRIKECGLPDFIRDQTDRPPIHHYPHKGKWHIGNHPITLRNRVHDCDDEFWKTEYVRDDSIDNKRVDVYKDEPHLKQLRKGEVSQEKPLPGSLSDGEFDGDYDKFRKRLKDIPEPSFVKHNDGFIPACDRVKEKMRKHGAPGVSYLDPGILAASYRSEGLQRLANKLRHNELSNQFYKAILEERENRKKSKKIDTVVENERIDTVVENEQENAWAMKGSATEQDDKRAYMRQTGCNALYSQTSHIKPNHIVPYKSRKEIEMEESLRLYCKSQVMDEHLSGDPVKAKFDPNGTTHSIHARNLSRMENLPAPPGQGAKFQRLAQAESSRTKRKAESNNSKENQEMQERRDQRNKELAKKRKTGEGRFGGWSATCDDFTAVSPEYGRGVIYTAAAYDRMRAHGIQHGRDNMYKTSYRQSYHRNWNPWPTKAAKKVLSGNLDGSVAVLGMKRSASDSDLGVQLMHPGMQSMDPADMEKFDQEFLYDERGADYDNDNDTRVDCDVDRRKDRNCGEDNRRVDCAKTEGGTSATSASATSSSSSGYAHAHGYDEDNRRAFSERPRLRGGNTSNPDCGLWTGGIAAVLPKDIKSLLQRAREEQNRSGRSSNRRKNPLSCPNHSKAVSDGEGRSPFEAAREEDLRQFVKGHKINQMGESHSTGELLDFADGKNGKGGKDDTNQLLGLPSDAREIDQLTEVARLHRKYNNPRLQGAAYQMEQLAQNWQDNKIVYDVGRHNHYHSQFLIAQADRGEDNRPDRGLMDVDPRWVAPEHEILRKASMAQCYENRNNYMKNRNHQLSNKWTHDDVGSDDNAEVGYALEKYHLETGKKYDRRTANRKARFKMRYSNWASEWNLVPKIRDHDSGAELQPEDMKHWNAIRGDYLSEEEKREQKLNDIDKCPVTGKTKKYSRGQSLHRRKSSSGFEKDFFYPTTYPDEEVGTRFRRSEVNGVRARYSQQAMRKLKQFGHLLDLTGCWNADKPFCEEDVGGKFKKPKSSQDLNSIGSTETKAGCKRTGLAKETYVTNKGSQYYIDAPLGGDPTPGLDLNRVRNKKVSGMGYGISREEMPVPPQRQMKDVVGGGYWRTRKGDMAEPVKNGFRRLPGTELSFPAGKDYYENRSRDFPDAPMEDFDERNDYSRDYYYADNSSSNATGGGGGFGKSSDSSGGAAGKSSGPQSNLQLFYQEPEDNPNLNLKLGPKMTRSKSAGDLLDPVNNRYGGGSEKLGGGVVNRGNRGHGDLARVDKTGVDKIGGLRENRGLKGGKRDDNAGNGGILKAEFSNPESLLHENLTADELHRKKIEKAFGAYQLMTKQEGFRNMCNNHFESHIPQTHRAASISSLACRADIDLVNDIIKDPNGMQNLDDSDRWVTTNEATYGSNRGMSSKDHALVVGETDGDHKKKLGISRLSGRKLDSKNDVIIDQRNRAQFLLPSSYRNVVNNPKRNDRTLLTQHGLNHLKGGKHAISTRCEVGKQWRTDDVMGNLKWERAVRKELLDRVGGGVEGLEDILDEQGWATQLSPYYFLRDDPTTVLERSVNERCKKNTKPNIPQDEDDHYDGHIDRNDPNLLSQEEYKRFKKCVKKHDSMEILRDYCQKLNIDEQEFEDRGHQYSREQIRDRWAEINAPRERSKRRTVHEEKQKLGSAGIDEYYTEKNRRDLEPLVVSRQRIGELENMREYDMKKGITGAEKYAQAAKRRLKRIQDVRQLQYDRKANCKAVTPTIMDSKGNPMDSTSIQNFPVEEKVSRNVGRSDRYVFDYYGSNPDIREGRGGGAIQDKRNDIVQKDQDEFQPSFSGSSWSEHMDRIQGSDDDVPARGGGGGGRCDTGLRGGRRGQSRGDHDGRHTRSSQCFPTVGRMNDEMMHSRRHGYDDEEDDIPARKTVKFKPSSRSSVSACSGNSGCSGMYRGRNRDGAHRESRRNLRDHDDARSVRSSCSSASGTSATASASSGRSSKLDRFLGNGNHGGQGGSHVGGSSSSSLGQQIQHERYNQPKLRGGGKVANPFGRPRNGGHSQSSKQSTSSQSSSKQSGRFAFRFGIEGTDSWSSKNLTGSKCKKAIPRSSGSREAHPENTDSASKIAEGSGEAAIVQAYFENELKSLESGFESDMSCMTPLHKQIQQERVKKDAERENEADVSIEEIHADDSQARIDALLGLPESPDDDHSATAHQVCEECQQDPVGQPEDTSSSLEASLQDVGDIVEERPVVKDNVNDEMNLSIEKIVEEPQVGGNRTPDDTMDNPQLEKLKKGSSYRRKPNPPKKRKNPFERKSLESFSSNAGRETPVNNLLQQQSSQQELQTRNKATKVLSNLLTNVYDVSAKKGRIRNNRDNVRENMVQSNTVRNNNHVGGTRSRGNPSYRPPMLVSPGSHESNAFTPTEIASSCNTMRGFCQILHSDQKSCKLPTEVGQPSMGRHPSVPRVPSLSRQESLSSAIGLERKEHGIHHEEKDQEKKDQQSDGIETPATENGPRLRHLQNSKSSCHSTNSMTGKVSVHSMSMSELSSRYCETQGISPPLKSTAGYCSPRLLGGKTISSAQLLGGFKANSARGFEKGEGGILRQGRGQSDFKAGDSGIRFTSTRGMEQTRGGAYDKVRRGFVDLKGDEDANAYAHPYDSEERQARILEKEMDKKGSRTLDGTRTGSMTASRILREREKQMQDPLDPKNTPTNAPVSSMLEDDYAKPGFYMGETPMRETLPHDPLRSSSQIRYGVGRDMENEEFDIKQGYDPIGVREEILKDSRSSKSADEALIEDAGKKFGYKDSHHRAYDEVVPYVQHPRKNYLSSIACQKERKEFIARQYENEDRRWKNQQRIGEEKVRRDHAELIGAFTREDNDTDDYTGILAGSDPRMNFSNPASEHLRRGDTDAQSGRVQRVPSFITNHRPIRADGLAITDKGYAIKPGAPTLSRDRYGRRRSSSELLIKSNHKPSEVVKQGYEPGNRMNGIVQDGFAGDPFYVPRTSTSQKLHTQTEPTPDARPWKSGGLKATSERTMCDGYIPTDQIDDGVCPYVTSVSDPQTGAIITGRDGTKAPRVSRSAEPQIEKNVENGEIRPRSAGKRRELRARSAKDYLNAEGLDIRRLEKDDVGYVTYRHVPPHTTYDSSLGDMNAAERPEQRRQFNKLFRDNYRENELLRKAFALRTNRGVGQGDLIPSCRPKPGQHVPDINFYLEEQAKACEYHDSEMAQRNCRLLNHVHKVEEMVKHPMVIPHDYPDEITDEYRKVYHSKKLQHLPELSTDMTHPPHNHSSMKLKNSSQKELYEWDDKGKKWYKAHEPKSFDNPLREKDCLILYGENGAAEYYKASAYDIRLEEGRDKMRKELQLLKRGAKRGLDIDWRTEWNTGKEDPFAREKEMLKTTTATKMRDQMERLVDPVFGFELKYKKLPHQSIQRKVGEPSKKVGGNFLKSGESDILKVEEFLNLIPGGGAYGKQSYLEAAKRDPGVLKDVKESSKQEKKILTAVSEDTLGSERFLREEAIKRARMMALQFGLNEEYAQDFLETLNAEWMHNLTRKNRQLKEAEETEECRRGDPDDPYDRLSWEAQQKALNVITTDNVDERIGRRPLSNWEIGRHPIARLSQADRDEVEARVGQNRKWPKNWQRLSWRNKDIRFFEPDKKTPKPYKEQLDRTNKRDGAVIENVIVPETGENLGPVRDGKGEVIHHDGNDSTYKYLGPHYNTDRFLKDGDGPNGQMFYALYADKRYPNKTLGTNEGAPYAGTINKYGNEYYPRRNAWHSEVQPGQQSPEKIKRMKNDIMSYGGPGVPDRNETNNGKQPVVNFFQNIESKAENYGQSGSRAQRRRLMERQKEGIVGPAASSHASVTESHDRFTGRPGSYDPNELGPRNSPLVTGHFDRRYGQNANCLPNSCGNRDRHDDGRSEERERSRESPRTSGLRFAEPRLKGGTRTRSWDDAERVRRDRKLQRERNIQYERNLQRGRTSYKDAQTWNSPGKGTPSLTRQNSSCDSFAAGIRRESNEADRLSSSCSSGASSDRRGRRKGGGRKQRSHSARSSSARSYSTMSPGMQSVGEYQTERQRFNPIAVTVFGVNKNSDVSLNARDNRFRHMDSNAVQDTIFGGHFYDDTRMNNGDSNSTSNSHGSHDSACSNAALNYKYRNNRRVNNGALRRNRSCPPPEKITRAGDPLSRKGNQDGSCGNSSSSRMSGRHSGGYSNSSSQPFGASSGYQFKDRNNREAFSRVFGKPTGGLVNVDSRGEHRIGAGQWGRQQGAYHMDPESLNRQKHRQMQRAEKKMNGDPAFKFDKINSKTVGVGELFPNVDCSTSRSGNSDCTLSYPKVEVRHQKDRPLAVEPQYATDEALDYYYRTLKQTRGVALDDSPGGVARRIEDNSRPNGRERRAMSVEARNGYDDLDRRGNDQTGGIGDGLFDMKIKSSEAEFTRDACILHDPRFDNHERKRNSNSSSSGSNVYNNSGGYAEVARQMSRNLSSLALVEPAGKGRPIIEDVIVDSTTKFPNPAGKPSLANERTIGSKYGDFISHDPQHDQSRFSQSAVYRSASPDARKASIDKLKLSTNTPKLRGGRKASSGIGEPKLKGGAMVPTIFRGGLENVKPPYMEDRAEHRNKHHEMPSDSWFDVDNYTGNVRHNKHALKTRYPDDMSLKGYFNERGRSVGAEEKLAWQSPTKGSPGYRELQTEHDEFLLKRPQNNVGQSNWMHYPSEADKRKIELCKSGASTEKLDMDLLNPSQYMYHEGMLLEPPEVKEKKDKERRLYQEICRVTGAQEIWPQNANTNHSRRRESRRPNPKVFSGMYENPIWDRTYAYDRCPSRGSTFTYVPPTRKPHIDRRARIVGGVLLKEPRHLANSTFIANTIENRSRISEDRQRGTRHYPEIWAKSRKLYHTMFPPPLKSPPPEGEKSFLMEDGDLHGGGDFINYLKGDETREDIERFKKDERELFGECAKAVVIQGGSNDAFLRSFMSRYHNERTKRPKFKPESSEAMEAKYGPKFTHATTNLIMERKSRKHDSYHCDAQQFDSNFPYSNTDRWKTEHRARFEIPKAQFYDARQASLPFYFNPDLGVEDDRHDTERLVEETQASQRKTDLIPSMAVLRDKMNEAALEYYNKRSKVRGVEIPPSLQKNVSVSGAITENNAAYGVGLHRSASQPAMMINYQIMSDSLADPNSPHRRRGEDTFPITGKITDRFNQIALEVNRQNENNKYVRHNMLVRGELSERLKGVRSKSERPQNRVVESNQNPKKPVPLYGNYRYLSEGERRSDHYVNRHLRKVRANDEIWRKSGYYMERDQDHFMGGMCWKEDIERLHQLEQKATRHTWTDIRPAGCPN